MRKHAASTLLHVLLQRSGVARCCLRYARPQPQCQPLAATSMEQAELARRALKCDLPRARALSTARIFCARAALTTLLGWCHLRSVVSLQSANHLLPRAYVSLSRPHGCLPSIQCPGTQPSLRHVLMPSNVPVQIRPVMQALTAHLAAVRHASDSTLTHLDALLRKRYQQHLRSCPEDLKLGLHQLEARLLAIQHTRDFLQLEQLVRSWTDPRGWDKAIVRARRQLAPESAPAGKTVKERHRKRHGPAVVTPLKLLLAVPPQQHPRLLKEVVAVAWPMWTELVRKLLLGKGGVADSSSAAGLNTSPRENLHAEEDQHLHLQIKHAGILAIALQEACTQHRGMRHHARAGLAAELLQLLRSMSLTPQQQLLELASFHAAYQDTPWVLMQASQQDLQALANKPANRAASMPADSPEADISDAGWDLGHGPWVRTETVLHIGHLVEAGLADTHARSTAALPLLQLPSRPLRTERVLHLLAAMASLHRADALPCAGIFACAESLHDGLPVVTQIKNAFQRMATDACMEEARPPSPTEQLAALCDAAQLNGWLHTYMQSTSDMGASMSNRHAVDASIPSGLEEELLNGSKLAGMTSQLFVSLVDSFPAAASHEPDRVISILSMQSGFAAAASDGRHTAGMATKQRSGYPLPLGASAESSFHDLAVMLMQKRGLLSGLEHLALALQHAALHPTWIHAPEHARDAEESTLEDFVAARQSVGMPLDSMISCYEGRSRNTNSGINGEDAGLAALFCPAPAAGTYADLSAPSSAAFLGAKLPAAPIVSRASQQVQLRRLRTVLHTLASLHAAAERLQKMPLLHPKGLAHGPGALERIAAVQARMQDAGAHMLHAFFGIPDRNSKCSGIADASTDGAFSTSNSRLSSSRNQAVAASYPGLPAVTELVPVLHACHILGLHEQGIAVARMHLSTVAVHEAMTLPAGIAGALLKQNGTAAYGLSSSTQAAAHAEQPALQMHRTRHGPSDDVAPLLQFLGIPPGLANGLQIININTRIQTHGSIDGVGALSWLEEGQNQQQSEDDYLTQLLDALSSPQYKQLPVPQRLSLLQYITDAYSSTPMDADKDSLQALLRLGLRALECLSGEPAAAADMQPVCAGSVGTPAPAAGMLDVASMQDNLLQQLGNLLVFSLLGRPLHADADAAGAVPDAAAPVPINGGVLSSSAATANAHCGMEVATAPGTSATASIIPATGSAAAAAPISACPMPSAEPLISPALALKLLHTQPGLLGQLLTLQRQLASLHAPHVGLAEVVSELAAVQLQQQLSAWMSVRDGRLLQAGWAADASVLSALGVRRPVVSGRGLPGKGAASGAGGNISDDIKGRSSHPMVLSPEPTPGPNAVPGTAAGPCKAGFEKTPKAPDISAVLARMQRQLLPAVRDAVAVMCELSDMRVQHPALLQLLQQALLPGGSSSTGNSSSSSCKKGQIKHRGVNTCAQATSSPITAAAPDAGPVACPLDYALSSEESASLLGSLLRMQQFQSPLTAAAAAAVQADLLPLLNTWVARLRTERRKRLDLVMHDPASMPALALHIARMLGLLGSYYHSCRPQQEAGGINSPLFIGTGRQIATATGGAVAGPGSPAFSQLAHALHTIQASDTLVPAICSALTEHADQACSTGCTLACSEHAPALAWLLHHAMQYSKVELEQSIRHWSSIPHTWETHRWRVAQLRKELKAVQKGQQALHSAVLHAAISCAQASLEFASGSRRTSLAAAIANASSVDSAASLEVMTSGVPAVSCLSGHGCSPDVHGPGRCALTERPAAFRAAHYWPLWKALLQQLQPTTPSALTTFTTATAPHPAIQPLTDTTVSTSTELGADTDMSASNPAEAPPPALNARMAAVTPMLVWSPDLAEALSHDTIAALSEARAAALAAARSGDEDGVQALGGTAFAGFGWWADEWEEEEETRAEKHSGRSDSSPF